MTYQQAHAVVRDLGLVLQRSDYNEYVVNFRHGREATAYYTTDLNDAVGTAHMMARSIRPNPRVAVPVSMQPAYYHVNPGEWSCWCRDCPKPQRMLARDVSERSAELTGSAHIREHPTHTAVMFHRRAPRAMRERYGR